VLGPLEAHRVSAHVPGHPEILDIRRASVSDADADRDRLRLSR